MIVGWSMCMALDLVSLSLSKFTKKKYTIQDIRAGKSWTERARNNPNSAQDNNNTARTRQFQSKPSSYSSFELECLVYKVVRASATAVDAHGFTDIPEEGV